MDREELIERLLEYAAFGPVAVSRTDLDRLEVAILRRLVRSARRSYESRGY
jgi:hypothetical protein